MTICEKPDVEELRSPAIKNDDERTSPMEN